MFGHLLSTAGRERGKRPLACGYFWPCRERFAGVWGLPAFVTFNAGWIAADLAQPQAFSPTHNDISDLGALTASSPWLYNHSPPTSRVCW
jgi:hypothetical protein